MYSLLIFHKNALHILPAGQLLAVPRKLVLISHMQVFETVKLPPTHLVLQDFTVSLLMLNVMQESSEYQFL